KLRQPCHVVGNLEHGQITEHREGQKRDHHHQPAGPLHATLVAFRQLQPLAQVVVRGKISARQQALQKLSLFLAFAHGWLVSATATKRLSCQVRWERGWGEGSGWKANVSLPSWQKKPGLGRISPGPARSPNSVD